jgi:hypothetical protein
MFTLSSFLVFTMALFMEISSQTTCSENTNIASNKPMTKWGPKLSKEELECISRLSTSDLAEMLKKGDALHAYAALKELKAGDRLKENIDLLLGIAAQARGDMIVEGLIKPIDVSSKDIEKCVTDKVLNFLENQLKKDRPSVSRWQVIRSLAQSVYIKDQWTVGMVLPAKSKSAKLPYRNEKVLDILLSSLESKDQGVQKEAIYWLGIVGANDPDKTKEVVARLETQLSKEEALTETKLHKEQIQNNIRISIEKLKQQIAYDKGDYPKFTSRGTVTTSSKPATQQTR